MTEQQSHQESPGGSSAPAKDRRRLTRSRDDRYIGGVAAGLADYFSVDPALVRVAFAVSLVLGGVGVLAYLVLLALVPIQGDPDEPAPPVTGRRRTVAIGGTVLVGVLACIASIAGGEGSSWLFGFGLGTLFGILLWTAVAAGLFWAVHRAGPRTGPASRVTGGETGETTTFAPSPTQMDPGEATPEPGDIAAGPEDDTAVLADPDTRPGGGPPTGAGPAVSGKQDRGSGGSGAPSTFGRIMTWIAIAFTGFVLLSILAVISFGLTALFGAIPAAALVILCGVGVVGLALADRPQFALWTAAAAIAIAIPMAVVSIASLEIEGDWGEINERPSTAFEIPAGGYSMAAGALKVDLRDFPFRNGETLDLTTASGFGATTVIVPDDVCVVGAIEGKVGYVDLRGSESGGIEPDRSLPAPAAHVPVLRLDSEFKLGYFGVFDSSGWRGRGSDWPDDLQNPDRSSARERATAACAGKPGRLTPGGPAGGSQGGGTADG